MNPDDYAAHVVHLENGRLAGDTPASRVAEIARKAAAHSGPIVFHFHGGLVPYRSGVEIAERLLPKYREEGGGYPIFFVWESGLLEQVRNNGLEIAKEKIYGLIWKRVSRIVARKFKQDAGTRALALPQVDTRPMERRFDESIAAADATLVRPAEPPPPLDPAELTDAESLALERELQRDLELGQEVEAVSNGLVDPATAALPGTRGATHRGSSRTLMSPEAIDRLVDRRAPGARGVISILKMAKAIIAVAARVISRFVRKRDHGFHATLVEEILREFYLANLGHALWEAMKTDAADAFGPDPARHGGTALLGALKGALEGRPVPRLVLVGHSAGAVYISEFLDQAEALAPGLAPWEIVFLAAASTYSKTAATICKHQARISSFRSFGMKDDVERDDHLVPILYPHSLLYFVSGVVETPSGDEPLVGMQRFHDAARFPAGRFPDVEAVRRFAAAGPSCTVWSVTTGAPAGQASASRKHGDFDNDATTLASLAHIVAHGF